MTTPGQSPPAPSWEGSPTFPTSATSSQFFFDRRGSAASTALASPTETICLHEVPKFDKHQLDKLAREHQQPQEIELAPNERDGEDASKRAASDLTLAGDAKLDQEDAAVKPPPPSHGRLLPLRQFLLCYACLAIAVFLTALDQTIGECCRDASTGKWPC